MLFNALVRGLALLLAVVPTVLVLWSPPALAQTLPLCQADALIATSAVVQGATGALAGTITISVYRAMPPCTVQGTPKIQVLDRNGNLLPVAQESASDQPADAGPVVLEGPADRPGFASVSIVWRNFCQAPAPSGPRAG